MADSGRRVILHINGPLKLCAQFPVQTSGFIKIYPDLYRQSFDADIKWHL